MRLLYVMLRWCLVLVIFLLTANIVSYLVLNYITHDLSVVAGITFSTAIIISYLVHKALFKIEDF